MLDDKAHFRRLRLPDKQTLRWVAVSREWRLVIDSMNLHFRVSHRHSFGQLVLTFGLQPKCCHPRLDPTSLFLQSDAAKRKKTSCLHRGKSPESE